MIQPTVKFNMSETDEMAKDAKNSIFSYHSQLDYSAPNYREISKRTVTSVCLKDKIGNRERLICRFLYEMGEMTSHHVQMAFSHPFVDPELIKISAAGKNPYLTEISTLENYGLIKTGRFTVRGKPSIKVYVLTRSAADWFAENMTGGQQYYDMSRSYRFKYPCETCIEELNHLAAVSYHIREVCSDLNLLSDYSPSYFEGINHFRGFYRYSDRSTLLLMPIRDPQAELTKAINSLNASLLSNNKNHLLFLTPDTEIMQGLRERLKSSSAYSDEKCLYTTDIQAMSDNGSPVIYKFSDKGMAMLLSTNDQKQ